MVADDDDDWDADDSPKAASKVNQREGMAFYNRAPLNAEQPAR